MDESSLPDDYVSRQEVQEQLGQRLDGDDALIHVAGQPGVGKTYLLNWVKEEFGDEYAVERVRLGSHHRLQTLTQKVYRTILNDIPESVKEGDRELTGASGSASAFGFGGGGGLSWTRDPPDWTENPFEYIEALEQMVDHVPGDHKRLICLDDIHNISDDEQKIKDALVEIADVLGHNITVLTAGRVQFAGEVPTIRLSTFTEAQVVELLTSAVPDIGAETARELHDRLSGHPYYLGLLVDIEDPAAAIEVPEGDIRDYIEIEYHHVGNLIHSLLLRRSHPS